MGAALILGISGTINYTQVRDSVVQPIAIDVVNFSVRPFPMHQKPRQAVASVLLAAKLHNQITTR